MLRSVVRVLVLRGGSRAEEGDPGAGGAVAPATGLVGAPRTQDRLLTGLPLAQGQDKSTGSVLYVHRTIGPKVLGSNISLVMDLMVGLQNNVCRYQ